MKHVLYITNHCISLMACVCRRLGGGCPKEGNVQMCAGKKVQGLLCCHGNRQARKHTPLRPIQPALKP